MYSKKNEWKCWIKGSVFTSRFPMSFVLGDDEKLISIPFISAEHAVLSRTAMLPLYGCLVPLSLPKDDQWKDFIPLDTVIVPGVGIWPKQSQLELFNEERVIRYSGGERMKLFCLCEWCMSAAATDHLHYPVQGSYIRITPTQTKSDQ